jgi:Raf kinase inhibitor-like YbhB/YbcL family protein
MCILTSSEIVEQGIIPAKYTMDNPNQVGVSPPLSWSDAPQGTKSFALALVDPDVPLEEEWFPAKDMLKVGTLPGDLFVHWMVYDIPASATGMKEGEIPAGAKELTNNSGMVGYFGMGPPAGHKAHKYIFTLYALSVDKLGLSPDASYVDFTNAMKGKILAAASLTGYFGH